MGYSFFIDFFCTLVIVTTLVKCGIIAFKAGTFARGRKGSVTDIALVSADMDTTGENGGGGASAAWQKDVIRRLEKLEGGTSEWGKAQ